MKTSIWHGEKGIDIEYVLHKAKEPSEVIVLSFPGALGHLPFGEWGYMLTIQKLGVNALFLRSNAELSKSRMTFFHHEPVIETAIIALLNRCIEETGSKRVIVVGSSMGGFCSLYYGLKYDWDIISGSAPYSFESDESVMYAAGTVNDEEKKWINNLLPDIIKTAGDRGYHKRCFIEYGEGEHLWLSRAHGKKLISDLESAHISYDLKLLPFSSHATIHRVFPSVLGKKLENYLGISEETDDLMDVLSPEAKFLQEWDKGCTSIMSLMDMDHGKTPCVTINACRQYADKNLWTALRNYLYIKNGWFWTPRGKNPIKMSADDKFWRIAISTDKEYAIGFLFQGMILHYCEQKNDKEMWNWCVENMRQYLSANLGIIPQWRYSTTFYRIHFFLAFHKMAVSYGMKDEWLQWIPMEIDTDLKKIFKSRGSLLTAWKYRFILLLLHIAIYYSNDKEFHEKLYDTLLELLLKMLDFDFDQNGVPVSGQILSQDVIFPELCTIVEFIDENKFIQSKILNKLKKKYKKISDCAAHARRPDGVLPALGASVYEKSRQIGITKRIAENFIAKDSNIAFLEDKDSTSYITINGGSNTHSRIRHCDLLSFTWYYDGQQIFYDAGGGSDVCEKYANSSIAHNAFICEETEYITPDYDDWTTIDEVQETEEYVSVFLSHYLIDNVKMARKIWWFKPNVMILVDEANSEENRSFTQNFLLGNFSIEKKDKNSVIVHVAPGFDVSIVQCLVDSNTTLTEYRGTSDASDTEHFRGSQIIGWKKLTNGLNLAYTKKGCAVKFVTIIQCHNNSSENMNQLRVKEVRFDKSGKMVVNFFDKKD